MSLLLKTDMVDWESMRSQDGSMLVREACAIMIASWARDVPVVTGPLLGLFAVVENGDRSDRSVAGSLCES